MEDSGFLDLYSGVEEMNNYCSVADAVHQSLLIHKLCWKIVDTPEFQRLRSLKQCGLADHVYPTANHTRFEHSLGVAAKANTWLHHLELNSEENIQENHKLCIQIAGLCHDLGHGPFSHLWEQFLELSGKKWRHETSSAEILNYIIKKHNLVTIFNDFHLNDDDISLIYSLILGNAYENPDCQPYLFEIIANKTNGVDVDKMEYLKRDCSQFAMAFSIDENRILQNMRICEKAGKKHIGFRDKVAMMIFEMFLVRAKMHLTCYKHPVAKIFETMLIDVLLEADKYFEVKLENGEIYKLSECHDNIEAFLKINDDLLNTIQFSIDPNLKKARDLILRIRSRDIYTVIIKEDLSRIKKTERERLKNDILCCMREHFLKFDFRGVFISYNIGEGACDPLEKVVFFDKEGKIVKSPKTVSIFSHFYTRYTTFEHCEFLLMCTLGKNTLRKDKSKHLKVQEMKEKAHELIKVFLCQSSSRRTPCP